LLPKSVVAAELELGLGLLGAGVVVEEGVDDAGVEEGVWGAAGASWPWTAAMVARSPVATAARNPGNPSMSFIVRFTLICQRRALQDA
jgi:hypothetical protein